MKASHTRRRAHYARVVQKWGYPIVDCQPTKRKGQLPRQGFGPSKYVTVKPSQVGPAKGLTE